MVAANQLHTPVGWASGTSSTDQWSWVMYLNPEKYCYSQFKFYCCFLVRAELIVVFLVRAELSQYGLHMGNLEGEQFTMGRPIVYQWKLLLTLLLS